MRWEWPVMSWQGHQVSISFPLLHFLGPTPPPPSLHDCARRPDLAPNLPPSRPAPRLAPSALRPLLPTLAPTSHSLPDEGDLRTQPHSPVTLHRSSAFSLTDVLCSHSGNLHHVSWTPTSARPLPLRPQASRTKHLGSSQACRLIKPFRVRCFNIPPHHLRGAP